jgi:DNA-binding beta-propeller fold protein YncE
MSQHKQTACTIALRSRRWIASAKWALCLVALALFVVPVAAQATGNVYVTNAAGNANTVSQYAIGADGALSSLNPATIATDSFPHGIAVTPDGKSAYVANSTNFGFGSGTVSQYSIDPLSGALWPKTPATLAAGGFPVGIAVTPDGRSAYVTNEFSGTVSQYSIDPASGALSPKTPETVAAGPSPVAVATTPDGKSAYVANSPFPGPGSVSQYNIDPVTGRLSPKTPATIAAGREPTAVAVNPDGKSVYVTNGADDTVAEYNIAPTSGALSLKTPATVQASTFPVGIGVTPGGKSAYVATAVDIVLQYSIDPASGQLSPKTPGSVATGVFGPSGAIAVTPDGTSAYVTNAGSNSVSQYSIDPASGALSPKTPPDISAGGAPSGIAVRTAGIPTSKNQCKNGDWRNYPQFKNQGQCVAFVVKQAPQKCLTERAKIGLLAFRHKYGRGPDHVRAMRRCINQASR